MKFRKLAAALLAVLLVCSLPLTVGAAKREKVDAADIDFAAVLEDTVPPSTTGGPQAVKRTPLSLSSMASRKPTAR